MDKPQGLNQAQHIGRGSNGDGVVSAVLDEVIELKSWDSETILPEHKLGSDLGMNEAEIAIFAQRLSQRFLASGSFEFSNWHSFSLRQIVELIRAQRAAKAG